MLCFHNLLPHRIWIDKCRARASLEGAAFHLDRQVSSEITTGGCNISCGSTGVEREHHEWVRRIIWIDRCRARASPEGAALHLDWQVLSASITSGCHIAFGSAGVEREHHQWVQHFICFDRCRTKCNVAPTRGALAPHLSIQMNCCTRWSWSRSTPVDPNELLHPLVMLSLDILSIQMRCGNNLLIKHCFYR